MVVRSRRRTPRRTPRHTIRGGMNDDNHITELNTIII